MDNDQLSDVIAERELEGSEEEPSRVVVRIARPVRDPELDWTCSYQITGAGDERVRTAHGIDAVQALQICLGMIRADLGSLQRAHSLTWLGNGELGL